MGEINNEAVMSITHKEIKLQWGWARPETRKKTGIVSGIQNKQCMIVIDRTASWTIDGGAGSSKTTGFPLRGNPGHSIWEE
jgi:hypothetical protein